MRDDDLHLARRGIPAGPSVIRPCVSLAAYICHCVSVCVRVSLLPGAFSAAASNARDAFLRASYTLRPRPTASRVSAL